jgi:cyclopropane fatty-acyl-phospholipid synthase-like methyltransferase
MALPQSIDGTEVARFYDNLRRSVLSAAALVHGDAYVGQECLLTPAEMLAFARRAGMTSETPVLDIGSGTGGPACYLAQQLGCRVLGVDVSTVGHAQAMARARDQGLTHLVQFQHGDVHTVDLPTAAFDVILGLDAWCHIPHRGAMLQRCAAWLRPGGRIAFYDHIERQPLPEEQRQLFYALWRFPGLETSQSYVAALEAAGFRVCSQDETSTYAVRFYTRLLTSYVEQRASFEAARGPERYQEGLQRLQMTQRFATEGRLGQIICIAEKLTHH